MRMSDLKPGDRFEILEPGNSEIVYEYLEFLWANFIHRYRHGGTTYATGTDRPVRKV